MRDRYRKLYEANSMCQSKDIALGKQIKALTSSILAEKITFEKVKAEESEAMKNLRKMEQERDSVQKVLDYCPIGPHLSHNLMLFSGSRLHQSA